MDVAAELRALAARGACGRLDIRGCGNAAHVVLRDGRICSIKRSGGHPALGMRLVSGGCVSLTNLGAALTTQQQHPHMRLGDVLVRMGLVRRADVEAVAWEQMSDDAAAILRWTDATAAFSPMPADRLPAPGPSVEDLLTAAGERAHAWQQVVRRIGGPDTVPSLCDDLLGTRDVALRPTDWAVLCRIDGQRSLSSIAEQAGLTALEAAQVLDGLIAAGMVTVPETHLPPPVAQPAPWPAPATAPPTAPAPPPPATPAEDEYADPADLLRELSQLGADPATRRRGGH